VIKEILADYGKGISNLQNSYKRTMNKYKLTLNVRYYTLLKKITKKQPWDKYLKIYQHKVNLQDMADSKYRSTLIAKCFLKWLSLLVTRKQAINNLMNEKSFRRNKENQNSNISLKHSGSTYLPSSKRINRLFENLSNEKEYKVKLKCIHGWRQAMIEIRQDKFYKEQFTENWLVAIHFNEQMLYTKALLGFILYKENSNKVEKAIEDIEVSRAILCLSKCLRIWQDILCSLIDHINR